MVHDNKSKLLQQHAISQLPAKYQHLARYNFYCCLECRHQHAANIGDANAHFGSRKCQKAQLIKAAPRVDNLVNRRQ